MGQAENIPCDMSKPQSCHHIASYLVSCRCGTVHFFDFPSPSVQLPVLLAFQYVPLSDKCLEQSKRKSSQLLQGCSSQNVRRQAPKLRNLCSKEEFVVVIL